MATRHNTCTNPCLTNDDTGWADGAEVPARTSVTGFVRPFAARYTTNVAGFVRTPPGAVVAGEQYTVSVDIRPANAATGTIYAEWRDSGGSVLTYTSNGYSAAGGVVTRISHTGTAPVNAAFVRIIIDNINFAFNTTDITAVLIEQAAAVDDYFDGDSPGATWDGTPGNSASTLDDAPALSGTGTLNTTATLTASGSTSRSSTGSTSVAPTLSSAGTAGRAGTGALATTAALSGTGSTARSGTGVLSTLAVLTGSGFSPDNLPVPGVHTASSAVTSLSATSAVSGLEAT